MFSARLSLLAASALLAGCLSVGPDYERPALDLPEGWSNPEDADAIPADAVTARWWTIYNDTALELLVDEAYKHNNDLVVAAARVDETRAQLGITRADQYPTINAGASAGRARISEVGSVPVPAGADVTSQIYRADVTLSYEVDFWGRYRHANEAARAELLASEAARDAVRSALAADVVQGYFALIAFDAQLDATRRFVARGQESLKLQKLRWDAGVISELDFQQRAAEVEGTNAQLPVLERERGRQERALAVLLGRSPRALIEESIARAETEVAAVLPPVIPAGLPSTLLLARPDLREAEQRLVAANARIGAARAAFFPSISLTGAAGSESVELSDLFGGAARTWSFAAAIVQPLFSGGRLYSQSKAARAREVQAVAQYRTAIANAFRDVQDAIDAQTRAREIFEAETRRTRALERAYTLAKLRYENGVASQLDVLDSERQSLAAELNRIEAQRALRAAVADLYRAIGAGGEPRAR